VQSAAEGAFLFKVPDDGTVHRVHHTGTSIAALRSAVFARLHISSAMAAGTALLYEDDEADRVVFTTVSDKPWLPALPRVNPWLRRGI